MDFLSLDVLKQQTEAIESKSSYVDDTPNVMLESADNANILTNGKNINNEIDFSDLEDATNALAESSNPELTNKITERMKQSMTTNNNTQNAQPVAAPAASTAPVTESTANPSENVTDMNAFKNAKPVSQTEFVTANTDAKKDAELNKNNTAANLDVTTHASDTSADKQSEKAMNAMKDGADDNKKWADVATKQTVLKQKAVKFESFMESLKTDSNKSLIESASKAFDLLIKKYL